MKQAALIPLFIALAFTPAAAQDDKKAAPSPGEITAAAPAGDWMDIAADDLLVMTLAPDAKGRPRRVIMQLMPAPFSQGWVANIRTLAKAHWYDGNAIYRVQDNYVTQWGDPNGDDEKKAKKLPDGLKTMPESDYALPEDALFEAMLSWTKAHPSPRTAPRSQLLRLEELIDAGGTEADAGTASSYRDPYANLATFYAGWTLAGQAVRDAETSFWPVHCYGAVGVARGQRPNTGDGTSLYAVNGHAPRHLDRNIAMVGRIIEGMEHLSGLPRGTEALGFYKDEADFLPILSVRLASELPSADQPHLQYLSTESDSFARYADARANRRDPFFLVPAGGADICNIPVPIRRKP